jgi:hypothetical protein
MKRVKGSGRRCGVPEDEQPSSYRFHLQAYRQTTEEHAASLDTTAGVTSNDQIWYVLCQGEW